MLRLPAPLRPGDRVRVVAPCGTFDRAVFDAGIELLQAAGLTPVFEPHIFSAERYLAGSDARRLAELNAAIADDTARCVWTVRGGYGATRLLPDVSVEAVARSGKWLVGFSDPTALHALWHRAGWATVHGANIATLSVWSAAARAELFSLLFAPTVQTYGGRRLRGAGRAAGTLFGGNLTMLASMAGTGALANMKGGVLFLEDVGERPYRLDRMVTQLAQAGALAGVQAVVLGQFSGCVEPPGRPPMDAHEAILAALGDQSVPVLAGLPLGHDADSRAVLLGGHATVDCEAGTLTVAPPAATAPTHG